MRADSVEVTWDDSKRSWLVRIISGEEVIRRYAKLGKDANQQMLRANVQKTLADEGFEPDAGHINIAAPA